MDSHSTPGVLTASGAVLTTLATERRVKLFAVVEPELEQLSMLNSESVLFFSLGSGLGGYAIDLLRDVFVKEVLSSIETCIDFGILSVICYALGIFRLVKRGSVVKEIMARSEPRS